MSNGQNIVYKKQLQIRLFYFWLQNQVTKEFFYNFYKWHKRGGKYSVSETVLTNYNFFSKTK